MLIVNYGPRGLLADALLYTIAGLDQQSYNVGLLIATVLIPAIAPLVTLLYSRPVRPARQPALGLGDLDLEYSSLNQPPQ